MTKDAIIRHAISLGITFIAVFFFVVSLQISSPDFVFSKEALKICALSGIIAAVRSVAKMIYELCYNYLTNK